MCVGASRHSPSDLHRAVCCPNRMSRAVPGKILRLMSPQSYYCITGTFLQEIDFRVRFANNERAGTGGRLSTSTPLERNRGQSPSFFTPLERNRGQSPSFFYPNPPGFSGRIRKCSFGNALRAVLSSSRLSGSHFLPL